MSKGRRQKAEVKRQKEMINLQKIKNTEAEESSIE